MTNNTFRHITVKALSVIITAAAVLTALPVFGSAADKETYYTENEETVVIENAKSFSRLGKYSEYCNLIIRDSELTDRIDLTEYDFGNITFENCKIESEEILISDYTCKLSLNHSDFEDFSDCFDSLKNNDSLEIEFVNFCSEDLSFLSDFDELDILTFTNCQLNSISKIGEMENLYGLYLSNTGVEKIDEIRTAKNLDIFYIDGSYISDLSPLENNDTIETLGILNAPLITDLSVIKTMSNLECLYSQNMEMALTEDIMDYIRENGIESDFSYNDLALKQQVADLADRIIADGMTDREKVKAITDYLVNNLEYDYNVYDNDDLTLEYNLHALKYALSGKGCCVNYSYLTQAVLNLKGVKTYNVLSDGHIYNLVNIDNDYLWLDVTFITPDPEEQMKYNFLADDENFECVEHEYFAIPASVYRFRTSTGETVINTSDNTDFDGIMQNAGSGETTTKSKLTVKENSVHGTSHEVSDSSTDSVPDFFLTVFVVASAAALILLAAAMIIAKT